MFLNADSEDSRCSQYVSDMYIELCDQSEMSESYTNFVSLPINTNFFRLSVFRTVRFVTTVSTWENAKLIAFYFVQDVPLPS